MKWLMRMLGKSKKNRDGFTLIELMVVLIIIAILAVAAVPTYMYFVHRAYESEAAASLGAIKTALIVYKAEHGGDFVGAGFGDPWAELGITTGDFGDNKWFTYECFALESTSADFTAWADGSKSATETSKVGKIILYLNSTSDVEDADSVTGSPDYLD